MELLLTDRGLHVGRTKISKDEMREIGPGTAEKTTYPDVSRYISRPVEVRLYAGAAGRCQFPGCNRWLLSHHVTHEAGNFAEKAHIIPVSEHGPRAVERGDLTDLNDVNNLMLLCAACHKFIDDRPESYPATILRKLKCDHERRVFAQTEAHPSRETKVVTVLGCVRGDVTTVTTEQIRQALGDIHYNPLEIKSLDLSGTADAGDAYWPVASASIKAFVQQVVSPLAPASTRGDISLFAFARIPLLAYLGNTLSSKTPIRVYSRHRMTEAWQWSTDEHSVGYEAKWLVNNGGENVVMLLSLSGSIDEAYLPEELRNASAVVEIVPTGGPPSPNCIRTEAALTKFRECYQVAMGEVRLLRPSSFSIVPAVPVAAAVHIGRDLLPTLDPPVRIYDWMGDEGYQYALTVNDNDRQ